MYGALCDRGFGEIAVTGRAGDARLVVRFVTELYMSIAREAVDSHPGNFDVPVRIFNYLLHFRFFFRQLGVAEHALAHGRNARGIANIGSAMAVYAVHSRTNVRVVREGHRLLRHGGEGAEYREPRGAARD